MDAPDMLYITVANYKTSSNEVLTGISDPQLQSLIIDQMIEIDAFIGEGWERYDPDQEFIFPRAVDTQNNAPYILRIVERAARDLADASLRRKKKGILAHEIISETKVGHSWTRRSSAAVAEAGFEHWPPSVIGILQPLRRFGGVLAVSGTALNDSI